MIRFSTAITLYFISLNLYAQTGHYWTESYGTRSMLLNGIVVGSVEDLGAVFYNPARLSQFESPAFVISGKVYQLNKITIENGLGDGINLKKSDFGGAPSLVSGTFKIPFLEGHKFAYAFLTRSRSDRTFKYSVDEFGDFVKAFPGDEYFSGEITSSNTASDEWIGLSWSYPFNEKFSVGVSGFYSNLERSAGVRMQLQAYSPDSTQSGMFIQKRGYSYNTQSILGKVGLSWQREKITWGLTVTTPKFEGIGSASTSYETFLAGVDTTGNGNNDDIYIINNQKNLEENHKTPWSVAVGTGIQLSKRSILHVSAEWYAAIPSYTVLESKTFIGQSTGEELKLSIVDELSSVINYGLGLEVYINENVSLFGSFATDFSAVVSKGGRLSEFTGVINDNTFRADIFHLGFGTDIKTKFADLTIGATYANSKETARRDFSIDDGQNPVTTDAQIIWNRWRFLVGFEFHFLDKLEKKLEDTFN